MPDEIYNLPGVLYSTPWSPFLWKVSRRHPDTTVKTFAPFSAKQQRQLHLKLPLEVQIFKAEQGTHCSHLFIWSLLKKPKTRGEG